MTSAGRPRVFLGASSKADKYCHAVMKVLEEGGELAVDHWRDTFHSGTTPIESLMRSLDEYDFGVFVLTPDDVLLIQDQEASAPPDNVILELGLFIGRLGRDRTFFIVPTGLDQKMPSDLLAVIAGQYDEQKSDARSAVRTAAYSAKESMVMQGVLDRGRTSASSPTESLDTGNAADHADEGWRAAAAAGVLQAINVATLQPDDRVVHSYFGVGRIVEIGPDLGPETIVVVDFGPRAPARVRSENLFYPSFGRR